MTIELELIRGRENWRCTVCDRLHREKANALRCSQDELVPVVYKMFERIRYINRPDGRIGEAVIVGFFNWNGAWRGETWKPHEQAYVCRSDDVPYDFVVDEADVLDLLEPKVEGVEER